MDYFSLSRCGTDLLDTKRTFCYHVCIDILFNLSISSTYLHTHSVYTAPKMVGLKCPMPFYKQSHTLQTTVHNSLILLTINQAVNH